MPGTSNACCSTGGVSRSGWSVTVTAASWGPMPGPTARGPATTTSTATSTRDGASTSPKARSRTCASRRSTSWNASATASPSRSTHPRTYSPTYAPPPTKSGSGNRRTAWRSTRGGRAPLLWGERGVQPIIGAAKIAPKPGGGQVYGDAFIQDREVYGLPPHLQNLGDNRGFDSSVGPEKSRASFMVDYENGLAIVRQNPTHATDGAAGVHPAQVGIEQDPGGRVRMRLQATNGLLPEAVGDLGMSVRGDFIVDPHGGPHGVPSVNGKVTQYPSWEAYSSQVGQPPTTVLQRQQNPGGDLGPAMNLPRPSVDVGQRPQVLDQWRQQYHPDQASQAALRGYIDNHVIDPVHQVHDPAFYDYPMPDLPGSTPDGDGGIIIPPAGQVR